MKKKLLVTLLGFAWFTGLAVRDVDGADPKVWDDEALANLEVPPAGHPERSSKHIPSDYYYEMSERYIFKTYPVYHPDKEPEGYMEWLAKQEPEFVFDASKLKTEADWIRAGELVFFAPIHRDSGGQLADVRDPQWYKDNEVPVTAEGILPFVHYLIRKPGRVELGTFSCGMCHTRVMPDGSTIVGAQGNYPLDRIQAGEKKRLAEAAENKEEHMAKVYANARVPFAVPWIEDDPHARYSKMSMEEIVEAQAAIPAGVQARFATSIFHPVQVPDLIGVRERRYLDRTGHARHRNAEDLMRYAAINQGGFIFSRHGDFAPRELPSSPRRLLRYSDESLRALARFLYSLEPPENPNKFDSLANRGKEVFENEGCWRCHSPPLYTNNKLTPVEGFKVPEDHPDKKNILPKSVGTDPGLALKTRRGTGFYKVPSLKGVWYRGPFQHSGAVLTLEDWFDPRRLNDDYVPTGFRGVGETGPVKGHPFGLKLSEEDRKALIAFLKTL